jgi:thiol-disulfide isomerase/thioredoxin
MKKIQFFTKKYCGLCEDLIYRLSVLQEKYRFEIEQVDVEKKENKQWLRKYYYDIPVMHLEGKRIPTLEELEKALKE